MKSRETKQKDLAALTESLQKSKSAMLVSFSKLSVSKDQEFRNSLRDAGAEYQVVKNTLARIAVKGTQFEPATEHFKGVTAIAWTENDPVVLSKAISKFMKENADTYTFKTGVLDGQLLDLGKVTQIANLPSKEELISKLLYVLNAQAQRIVTVISAVPRDLAVVIKQIGDAKPADGSSAPAAEAKTEEPAAPASESVAPAAEEAAPADEAVADAPASEAAPAESMETAEPAVASESESESAAAEPDEKAEELLASAPDADTEAGAEAIAAEPEVAAEQVVASSPALDTEAGSEAAAAAPDDVADDLLNPAEGDPQERAE